MKKCLIVLAMLFSCCMFFSCKTLEPKSNEFIMLSISNETNGQVRQSLYFTLGSEKLKAAGLDALEIEGVKRELIKNVTRFRDEFYLSFIITYNSNPNPQQKIGEKLVVSQTAYNETSDTVGFSIVFSSMETWNYYHSSSGGGESESEIGFMIKTSSTGTFPFAAKIGDITIGERYESAYLNSLKSVTNKNVEYDPDFVYDYATPSSVIKSDSEYKFESGLKHHLWLRKMEEYKQNDKINIYTLQPNRGLWYLTILAFTLLGLGIAIVIIKLKDKKRR